MTMPIPDGSVIVTPRQMYDEIQATRKAVDRLASTVDPALSDMRGDHAALALRVGAGETTAVLYGNRLTAIETKLNAAWAVIGLIGLALGIVAAFLGK